MPQVEKSNGADEKIDARGFPTELKTKQTEKNSAPKKWVILQTEFPVCVEKGRTWCSLVHMPATSMTGGGTTVIQQGFAGKQSGNGH